LISTVLGFAAVVFLFGCSNAPSGNVYKSSEALKPQQVRFAQLVAAQAVSIDTASDSNVGTIAGGAIGGIAGSRFGSGRGADALLGGVIGATVGALAGSATEKMAGKSNAWELTLKFEDSGELLSIVQAGDDAFVVGQKVRVLIQNGRYRVSP
jgi:outer membrane lipoprotein SlyB